MRFCKHLGPALALVILLCFCVPAFSQQAVQSKKILVLHHYAPDAKFRSWFDPAFIGKLQASSQPVDLFTETLENYRFSGPEHELNFRDYLKKKYEQTQIDVVVPVFEPAINFLLKYRHDLFPNVPIVFISANQLSTLEPGMTGLWRSPQLAETLALALQIHPRTNRVTVIDMIPNNSGAGQKQIGEYVKNNRPKLSLVWFDHEPFDEVLSKVKNLPDNSVLIFLRHATDGRIANQFQNVTAISQASNVPVYVAVDTHMGSGAVGGVVQNTSANAEALAALVLEVASGTKPEDVGAREAIGSPVFDWRQLRRFNIPEEQLPQGSVVLYRELTIWEQYRWRITITAGIFVVQAILIGFLLIERSRRQSTTELLQKSEERFAKAFRNNPQAMALTTVPEGRYLEVNESFEVMSGYTREEVLKLNSVELGFWNSREDRQPYVEELLNKGIVKNLETTFRAKDGSLKVLLSSAELIEVAGEQCTLLASTDITERKEHERQLSELTNRILRTQDDERRHIARELHDGTAQNIGVILLNLAQMQKTIGNLDTRNDDRLSESIGLGEQVLKEIRTLSYVLHPPLLDHAGLSSAIKWYLKGFSERTGIEVNFVEQGSNGERLDGNVEYAFFRVVQECLTNIRRHSNSETAEIRLTRSHDEVVLEVQDRGTDHKLQFSDNGDEVISVGVGVQGMRHRLKQLGGTLRFDSNKSGTKVTATVPLNGVLK